VLSWGCLLCKVQTIRHDPKVINLIHIPKTAGTSFVRDMRTDGIRVADAEKCARRQDVYLRPVKSIMFRLPRAHVFSQYLQCRFSRWGFNQTANETEFPRDEPILQGFEKWLAVFANQTLSDPMPLPAFNCYNPWNMQARALVCYPDTKQGPRTKPRSSHHVHTPSDMVPPLVDALDELQRIGLVGVTELYEAFLCMAVHQINLWNATSVRVRCGVCSSSPGPVSYTHEAHKVPAHDFLALPEEANRLIDRMTRIDSMLYSAVLRRVLTGIQNFETRTRIMVLCPDHAVRFLRQVKHLVKLGYLLHIDIRFVAARARASGPSRQGHGDRRPRRRRA